jgi:hypothetical protein
LLAQLVEQGTLNAWVGGSSPSQPTYRSKALGSHFAQSSRKIQVFRDMTF